jgi:ferredoxin
MSQAQVETAVACAAFLNRQDEADWSQAIARLLPFIHEVDKAATQIWFKFYPLSLWRALEQAEEPEKLARRLLLQGKYYLKDQIDTSHRFLYGHRFWPEVKRAVTEHAVSFEPEAKRDLAAEIREVAKRVAADAKIEESLLIGITAVALMTLQQVGFDAFANAPGRVQLEGSHARKSPEQVLKARARDDRQGLFGFLKSVDQEWTVTFDETDENARYRMKNMTDLAYGAAEDQSRDWKALDPRCIEGPIPVECRSAACGTCWVGVLGGAEKLSAVAPLERKSIRKFGYIVTDEPRPLIRLACQSIAHGAVSIVIPPWNGVFGKYLQESVGETDAARAAETHPSSDPEQNEDRA